MSFVTRLFFAWVCYFKVLFDGALAARVERAMSGEADEPKALPEKAPEPEEKPEPKKPEPEKKPEPKKADKPAAPPETSALELLALLQREGRLVDFLQQDITSASDEDVGVAARVVHEGCRKALSSHVQFAPIRSEEEEAKVTVPEGYAPSEVKLTGNVTGAPPFSGTLRHKGWRVTECKLPEPIAGRDPRVVAPAEVEL